MGMDGNFMMMMARCVVNGEILPDEERDGLGTTVVEDVDGLLMPPASSLPSGVT
jgi:hypothetical protein